MKPNKPAPKKPAAKKKLVRKFDAQMMRIVSTMLDKTELVLAAIAPAPKPLPDDRDGAQRAVGRWTNNMLTLWRQCEKPACRRAQSCHGAPTACLMARGPNVPLEVLTCVKTMLAGRRQGVEAFDFAGPRNEVGAVKAWLGPSFPFPGRHHNLALHPAERQTALQGGR